MSPHIIFNDMAIVSHIAGQSPNTQSAAGFPLTKKPETSMADFLSSVEMALTETRLNPDTCQCTSTDRNTYSKRLQNHETSNVVQSKLDSPNFQNDYRVRPRGSINRFEIMRDGVLVAIILLGRPAFRLGESISVTIDFQQSFACCHSLMAVLESFEIIDPAIALRSQASIYRATRRIHASHFELTLFEKRFTFSPIAPLNATPNFQTSSVSLVWSLRFEFMISQEGVNGIQKGFLDEAVKNEKGSVSKGVQMVPCEKFEIAVPLNINGCISSSYLNYTINEFSI